MAAAKRNRQGRFSSTCDHGGSSSYTHYTDLSYGITVQTIVQFSDKPFSSEGPENLQINTETDGCGTRTIYCVFVCCPDYVEFLRLLRAHHIDMAIQDRALPFEYGGVKVR